MSKQKHTPGPWEWRYISIDRHELHSVPIDGKRHIVLSSDPLRIPFPVNTTITSIATNGFLEPIRPHDPNAKLIASAPELLEALYWAKGFGKNGPVYDRMIQDKIEAAIKKATS